MNRKEFTATAKANGLTVKQLVKLSMLQSAIYHGIKDDGCTDVPSEYADLGEIQTKYQEMRPVKKLAKLGFIELLEEGTDSFFRVTRKGWTVPCNSGASIFIGGCDDDDITDEPNGDEPKTRFDDTEPADWY